jgi:MoCo/4Fe-4S cofactor protein with predicted Tat translocation signal
MRKNFDLPLVKKKLAGKTGEKYWRSLDELSNTEEFQDFLQHEFAQGADQWLNPIGRRNFLKLMAASMALGGLAACSPTSAKKIVPYVRAPEEIVPGIPLHFATAFQVGGVASGVVVESHEGRPTKIEGNPDHPGSLGGTNVLAQASILDMYDPDRSQVIKNAGLVSSWDAFLGEFIVETSAQGFTGGTGLRVLTNTVTSPLMTAQLKQLQETYPEAKLIQYEPVNYDNAYEGAMLAFGKAVNSVYKFDKAKVVLSLEADFMSPGNGDVRYSHDFSAARRIRGGGVEEMNRMYLVESTPSITGAMADHRLAVQARHIKDIAMAVAAEVGLNVEAPAELPHGVPENWIAAVVEDLNAHAGESLVVAGRSQPSVVHALAHAMNEVLGNVGNTVDYTEPLSELSTNQTQSVQELVEDINNDLVNILVILNANPVHNLPRELAFEEALLKVPFRVHLGLYEDETAVLCQWHVPAKHYLESWGDARAYDGTVTLTQPLVEPLYASARSAPEILTAMLGEAGTADYDLVHDFWAAQSTASNFEAVWQESLFNGFVANTALPPLSVSVDTGSVISAINAATENAVEGIEVVFRPDPSVWDGQYANNGWLQEVPKPFSKLTWDNALLVSPNTAGQLRVNNEDVVLLNFNGRNLYMPVWIAPGQADETVTVFMGYGRQKSGRVGTGIGTNAYTIRSVENPWFGSGATIRSTGDRYSLASTQLHWNMEGRYPVRAGSFEQFKEDRQFVKHIGEHEVDPNLSLMPGWEYNSYKWGMVVDLTSCNGCNACVVACQAENNIPVVGKEQVRVGREMHWMRIDTYFEGDIENPHTYQQPMMCHHCEQAPCELVCPVAATVHDHEGLNVMVYNRCVGTRYCSNNCPYKARRFNYLQYSDQDTESLKGVRNPNVTVRVRGIMEKCTYCVQRISRARITAKNENRRIRDGEVVSACQASCPTKAIVFGDLNDPESQVAQLAQDDLNYGVLTELGVRPRTSYLARIRNPNPMLETAHGEGEHH